MHNWWFFWFFWGRVMSLIQYLNHRNFFVSVLPSILPCVQIPIEVWVMVFSDETSPNGDIYAYLTVAPQESPLPVPLPPLPPHRIGIRRLPPSSEDAAKSATKTLVAAKVPLISSHIMRWRLMTRGMGRWKVPLTLILPPLSPLPLTPLLLTPLPLLRRCRSHWEAVEMLVYKWNDVGADDGVDGWRRIFVSLICRFRREIKVSLNIILLQPFCCSISFSSL